MDPRDTIYILPQDGNAYEQSVFHNVDKDATKGEKEFSEMAIERDFKKGEDVNSNPASNKKKFTGISIKSQKIFMGIETNNENYIVPIAENVYDYIAKTKQEKDADTARYKLTPKISQNAYAQLNQNTLNQTTNKKSSRYGKLIHWKVLCLGCVIAVAISIIMVAISMYTLMRVEALLQDIQTKVQCPHNNEIKGSKNQTYQKENKTIDNLIVKGDNQTNAKVNESSSTNSQAPQVNKNSSWNSQGYEEGGYPIMIGQFENHLYDNGDKNSSHYVTITYNNATETYTWKNQAGANWTLYPTAKLNELKVGPDCPYYIHGHIVAKFTTDGVYGPGNELYTRKYINPLVTGEFENHLYDNGGKNFYHYVNITYDKDNSKYVWRNIGGVTWSLYPTGNSNQLRVGTDCSYYKNGYTVANFTRMGIYGPGNEIYITTSVNPWVIGTYENHLYDKGGKNNWHYVTITYNQTASTYTWRNKANVQWTLYPTKDENLLTVGKDCPYYKNGHTSAKIDNKGIYGPWNELYTRK